MGTTNDAAPTTYTFGAIPSQEGGVGLTNFHNDEVGVVDTSNMVATIEDNQIIENAELNDIAAAPKSPGLNYDPSMV